MDVGIKLTSTQKHWYVKLFVEAITTKDKFY